MFAAAFMLPGGAVTAADIETVPSHHVDVYSPHPAVSWHGFYGGINGGGTSSRTSHYDRFDGDNEVYSGSGGTIGVHGGYNWVFDKLLIGGELDFALGGPSGSVDASVIGSIETNHTFSARLRTGLRHVLI